jgi:uncharacterized membrane protein
MPGGGADIAGRAARVASARVQEEEPAMAFTQSMEHVAQAFEVLGTFVLAVGTLWSFLLAGLTWHRSRNIRKAYALVRQVLGGTLLLGLEILVAADLVRTIAVAPTLDNVLTLGLIVLIRTFLSFSIEVEISGVPPWRRGLASGAGMISRAWTSAPEPKRPDQPEGDRPG